MHITLLTCTTDTSYLVTDTVIQYYFLFALVWSVGATCDNDGRKKFDWWLRNTLLDMTNDTEHPLPKTLLFPDDGLVYDYRLNDGGVGTLECTDYQPPLWMWWM